MKAERSGGGERKRERVWKREKESDIQYERGTREKSKKGMEKCGLGGEERERERERDGEREVGQKESW